MIVDFESSTKVDWIVPRFTFQCGSRYSPLLLTTETVLQVLFKKSNEPDPKKGIHLNDFRINSSVLYQKRIIETAHRWYFQFLFLLHSHGPVITGSHRVEHIVLQPKPIFSGLSFLGVFSLFPELKQIFFELRPRVELLFVAPVVSSIRFTS